MKIGIHRRDSLRDESCEFGFRCSNLALNCRKDNNLPHSHGSGTADHTKSFRDRGTRDCHCWNHRESRPEKYNPTGIKRSLIIDLRWLDSSDNGLY
jgi:hypothetical protein